MKNLFKLILIILLVGVMGCKTQKHKSSEVIASKSETAQDSAAVTQVAKASEWEIKGNTLEKVDGSSKIVLSGAVSISLSPTQEIIATADHAEVETNIKKTKKESTQESKKESFDSLHQITNNKTEAVENISEKTTLDKEVKASFNPFVYVSLSLLFLLGVLLYLAKKGVFR